MRVLIADDHAVFRQGLKYVLADHFRKLEFGEADTAQSTLEQIWKEAWDVVLLDISMPGRNGMEIMKDIKQSQPELPVLILSAHSEEQYALRVLEAGAAGYVSKIQAPRELVTAIEQVLAGGRYITASIAEKLVNHLQSPRARLLLELLSHRELQVLRSIASGKTTKAIAQELSVSPQTISTHRARILKKLGLSTTAELMRYAFENELVD